MAEAQTETATGIALAGVEEDDGNQGVVAAVGPGKARPDGTLATPTVAKGDSVVYKSYAGTDATIEGKFYKIVVEEECLAKW